MTIFEKETWMTPIKRILENDEYKAQEEKTIRQ